MLEKPSPNKVDTFDFFIIALFSIGYAVVGNELIVHGSNPKALAFIVIILWLCNTISIHLVFKKEHELQEALECV